MLINNSFYKGNDLIQNRRDALKNLFNPYEYNLESNLKDQDNNCECIKTECHNERNKKKKA